jgi:hypothetical protein
MGEPGNLPWDTYEATITPPAQIEVSATRYETCPGFSRSCSITTRSLLTERCFSS